MERTELCRLADLATGTRIGALPGPEGPVLATPTAIPAAAGAALATAGAIVGGIAIGLGIGDQVLKGDEEEPTAPPQGVTAFRHQTRPQRFPVGLDTTKIIDTIPAPLHPATPEKFPVENVKYVASYNWIDAEKPTIIVPGKSLSFVISHLRY